MVSDSNQNQPSAPPSPSPPFLHPDDAILSDSQFLTAEETLRRRYRRSTQLTTIFKDFYWAIIADMRNKYRHYMWNFGSPVLSDASSDCLGFENKGVGDGEFGRCGHSHSCQRKPMAMSKFCYTHILSDPKQVLYKGCAYITSKSGSKVQTLCSKPILRSATPSFCNYHLLRAKKSVARSLKQAGLSTNESNRMAPLIHMIGAEFVREILRKRRTLKNFRGEGDDKMDEGGK